MPKRVLIVDDDPTVLALAKDSLQHAGYLVETAVNGSAAMNVLKRSAIHIIITDVVMPKMDGVDFFKELKKNISTMSIPVIVITGNLRYRELFNKLGVNYFLEKPFDTNRLIGLIKEILKDAESHDKILICGTDEKVVVEMCEVLEKTGYKAAWATKPGDFLAIAVNMTPRLIVLDLMFQEISTEEMIHALKCFVRLKDTKILTFTHFSPEELADIDGVEMLKQAKDECDEAGADQYIGRYSSTTFVGRIQQFN